MTTENALIGMPASRPFSTRKGGQVFILTKRFIENGEAFDSWTQISKALGLKGSQDRSYDGVIFARFEHEEVLGFSKNELKIFLDRSGYCVENYYGSTASNVFYVTLAKVSNLNAICERFPSLKNNLPRVKEYQFETKNYEGRGERLMSHLVYAHLAPVLKKKIIFSVPHGHTAEHSERGAFQVYVWSSPVGGRVMRPPERLYGFEVECRDRAFQPEVDEIDIANIAIKDGDYTVATLLPNALYIHHDLVENGTISELRIMNTLLTEVASLLATGVDFDKMLEAQKIAYEKRQVELFDNLLQKSIPARSGKIDTEINLQKESLEKARLTFARRARKLFFLEASKLDTKTVTAKLRDEIFSLKKGDFKIINSVKFSESERGLCLTVTTDDIIASGGGQKRNIGKYKISLGVEDCSIKVVNLTGSKIGPHLDGSGWMCLGNMTSEVTDYLANFEVKPVISIIIALLERPNTGDPYGKRFYDFPLAEEEYVTGGLAASCTGFHL